MDNYSKIEGKIPFNIYQETKSILDIYVDIIAEDLLPFQYGNISNTLISIIEYFECNNSLFQSLDEDLKEQISAIINIPSKLSYPQDIVKQSLILHLTEVLDLYKKKDTQIQQIVQCPDQDSQTETINAFIQLEEVNKKAELRSSILNKYNIKHRLVLYDKNNMSSEQKKALLGREAYVDDQIKNELDSWHKKKFEQYTIAVKVYYSPQQAKATIESFNKRQQEEFNKTKELLRKNEQLLRIGNAKSVEDYLLVRENILTHEESCLFSYEELYTYSAYYEEIEQVIRDIFQLAKSFYVDNSKKGLQELANVSHDKISYLFVFMYNLKAKYITFKDISDNSLEDLELLKNNSDLLKIMRPKAIIDLIQEDNVLTNKVLSEIEITNIGIVLRWAAKNGCKNVVTTLLERESCNISPEDKGTALRWATELGHLDIVTTLLERESRNISSIDKGNVLMRATELGHLDIVTTLLERESCNISPEDKGTALKWAAKNGCKNVVTTLLERESCNISSIDKGSALMRATELGHLNIVTTLLKRESRNISSIDKGTTLMRATELGHLNIVTTLLERESRNISSIDKGTTLRWATELGHLDIVTTLLERESRNISPEDKENALMRATELGYLNIVTIIQSNLGSFAAKILRARKHNSSLGCNIL
ncbi:MAG: ankyrin repeat domain-containing protein [Rickettsiales endosymbiont of Dermacentor nuttalli]